MVTASDRTAVAFSLSGGNAHDAPEGELLLDRVRRLPEQIYLLMDRAYEGGPMRQKAAEKGFQPVVSPKTNRKNPWEYDKERYKQRNAHRMGRGKRGQHPGPTELLLENRHGQQRRGRHRVAGVVV